VPWPNANWDDTGTWDDGDIWLEGYDDLLAESISAQSSVSTPSLNVLGGTVPGSGTWRGRGGGKKGKTYEAQPSRIRLLSELDPPLFTPQEVIEAPPLKPIVLDAATKARIESAALGSLGAIDNMVRKVAAARRIQDDEDEMMLMQ
jgi:hypothetical protein